MIIGGYTSYPPMIPLHQGGGGGYHVELQPGPPNQPPPIVQSQPPKGETKTIPGGAQVYHINLDPSSGPPSQSASSQQPSGKGPPPSSQPPPPSSVSHGKGHGPPQPQITMEKLNDRAYHPSHLPEGMYRMPMLGIPPPMPPSAGQQVRSIRWPVHHKKPMQYFEFQMQPVKPGGSISQGYSRANPSSGGPPSAAPPPPPQSQASQQPGQPPQMHYQRRYWSAMRTTKTFGLGEGQKDTASRWIQLHLWRNQFNMTLLIKYKFSNFKHNVIKLNG